MPQNLPRPKRQQHQAPEVKQPRQVGSSLSSISSEEQQPQERGRNRSPKRKDGKSTIEGNPGTKLLQKTDSVDSTDDEEKINKTESNRAASKTNFKYEDDTKGITNEEDMRIKTMDETMMSTEEKEKANEGEDKHGKLSAKGNQEEQENDLLKNDNEEVYDLTDGSSVSLDI